MRAVVRRTRSGSPVASGGTTTPSLGLTEAPKVFDLILVVIAFQSATAEVTSMALGAGTFSRLHRVVGATTSMEIWAGYGFAANETATTITMVSTAGANYTRWAHTFTNGATPHAAPTVIDTAGTSTSSTTLDGGAVTPTTSDETQLVFHAYAWKSTGAWQTATSLPGGAETPSAEDSGSLSYFRMRVGWRASTSLSDHNHTGTLSAAVEWLGAAVVIQPTQAVPHSDTHLYKGRSKESLDLAGVA